METIKKEVCKKILKIRTGEDDSEEARIAHQKKVKFLVFIKNMHVKAGLRRWKEQVFGLGGDPRYKILLTAERKLVRDRYVEPQLIRIKAIK